MAVGNRRLMERDGIDLAAVADHRQHLAEGRTALIVAVDGQAVGLFGIADAPSLTAAPAVVELARLGVEMVMLTGDNEATALHIASLLGVATTSPRCCPATRRPRSPSCSGGQHRRHGGPRRQRRLALALADVASPPAPAPTSPSRPPTWC